MMQSNYKPIKWETTPERSALLKLKAIFETGGDGQYSNELNIINEALAKGEVISMPEQVDPVIIQTIPL